MSENHDTLLPEAFDPETQEGNEILPVGWYEAQIIDTSVHQPNSGDGWQIALTWRITEGTYEGRLVWQRITFMHSSEQATKIGRRNFKDLCVATGISEQVTDVSVFKFISCRIRVGIQQDKQGVYPDKNQVSNVRSLDSKPSEPGVGKAGVKAELKTATVKPRPAQPATNAGNGTAPWRKPTAKPTSTGDAIDDSIPY
jgi:hypothetical protein